MAAEPVAAAPAATPEPEAIPAIETARPGRPVSPSMSATLELVAKNPTISAAELSRKLSVSPSYARTLLRRARAKAAINEDSSPRTQSSAQIRLALPAVAETPHLGSVVNELANRLGHAEDTIEHLRRARPQTRASWDLNSRAEVIRRSLGGEPREKIASDLGVPSGEIDFILKIHRIVSSQT